MSLRISYAPYRLLFKHPFETSHGVRDGTDSIFVRIEENWVTGYGEVTLPPYLKEKPVQVVERLKQVAARSPASIPALLRLLNDNVLFGPEAMGCRNGLYTASIDVLGKLVSKPVHQLIEVNNLKPSVTLVTLGITPVEDLQAKLTELPPSGGLKLKVGHSGSKAMIMAVKQLDPRPIFLDANQGLQTVAQAVDLAEADDDRLIGIEQPFTVNDRLMQRDLQRRLEACIYGDESIQNLIQLEQVAGIFNGVNIKLIKCGGLDRAKAMADRAVELGMKVMLGSMSESSLGCTAMAHLAGQADILDLDGPWLIKNDPFEGMDMRNGQLIMPGKPGIGAVLKAELDFIPIRA